MCSYKNTDLISRKIDLKYRTSTTLMRTSPSRLDRLLIGKYVRKQHSLLKSICILRHIYVSSEDMHSGENRGNGGVQK